MDDGVQGYEKGIIELYLNKIAHDGIGFFERTTTVLNLDILLFECKIFFRVFGILLSDAREIKEERKRIREKKRTR